MRLAEKIFFGLLAWLVLAVIVLAMVDIWRLRLP